VQPCKINQDIAHSARELAKFGFRLRLAKPDVLLPYCAVPNVACGLLWRLVGAKFCVWNQRDILMIPVNRLLEKLAVKNMPLFVSNSDHGAAALVEHYHVDRAKIEVVPNGIYIAPPATGRSCWREQLGIGQHD